MSKSVTTNGLSMVAGLDSVGRRLCKVYAEAFLGSLEHSGSLGESSDQLREFVKAIWLINPSIFDFFCNPTQPRENKAKTIKALMPLVVSNQLVDFLCVLNDHDRLMLLPAISDALDDILCERQGKVKVQVTSVSELDEESTSSLLQQLRTKLGREPVVEARINPDLLGGLVIRVGDWVWDGSLSKQVDELRNQLFERGNHAIQGGRDRFRSDK